jgi:molybdopterin-guanine dinucleotide biosynthesis protein A
MGGIAKGLIEIEGQPILGTLLDRLTPLADETLLLTNADLASAYAPLLDRWSAQSASAPARPPVHTVLDPEKHAGPVAAFVTGLERARGRVCLAVACDMPFASAALYRQLITLRQQHNAVAAVPRAADLLQPFHAVYRRQPALEVLRNTPTVGKLLLIGALHRMQPAILDVPMPEARAFANLNTPADLEAAVSPQTAASFPSATDERSVPL